MTGTTDLDDLREHDLAVELGALAHPVDAPPSRVDITAAVHAGRRLRVRRCRARVATTALALAAATVGALLAVPRLSGSPDPASHGQHGRSRWKLTGGVDSRDPLLSTAQFGWLPPNLKASGYTTDSHWDDARATGTTNSGPSLPPALVFLYVYPRGVNPAIHGARDPHPYTVPAPNVNGRRAYWVTTDPNWPVSNESELRWQTADGRWVELVARYLPVAGQQRTLLRIAETAVVGTRSVPMPMSITGLPAGTVVGNSFATDDMMNRAAPNWSASVGFELHGYYFSLTVGPHDAAVLADGNPFETKACVTSKGLDACLLHEGRTQPPAALTELGGLRGLLSHVRVYGPDPSHWTTHVLP